MSDSNRQDAPRRSSWRRTWGDADARRLGRWCAACALMVVGVVAAGSADRAVGAGDRARFDTVVIDAGHGGEDDGAIGHGGLREKDLVLDVARDLARRLAAERLNVVMTRNDDSTVALERRTAIANDARGDLFVSIHANSAPQSGIRGSETFFLSLEASDDAANRVAARENAAFGGSAADFGGAQDPLVAILGDLIVTEHLRESSEFAGLAQTELAKLDRGHSRGVKQAPFVVLNGVQMPASLVEIGFITNPGDARQLRSGAGRAAVVTALLRAVQAFGRRYDARHHGASAPAEALEAPQ